jgi:hypothetical protein
MLAHTYFHLNILKIVAMLNDTNLHYLKVAVLQDVISYSLIDIYPYLKETYLYQQVALKRPYTSTQNTRLHIPEHKFQ